MFSAGMNYCLMWKIVKVMIYNCTVQFTLEAWQSYVIYQGKFLCNIVIKNHVA